MRLVHQRNPLFDTMVDAHSERDEEDYSSTGHQIRSRKLVQAGFPFLRMGAFYTKFGIMTPEFHVFLNLKPASLNARF